MRKIIVGLDKVELEMLQAVKKRKSEFCDLPKMVKDLIKSEYEKGRLPRR